MIRSRWRSRFLTHQLDRLRFAQEAKLAGQALDSLLPSSDDVGSEAMAIGQLSVVGHADTVRDPQLQSPPSIGRKGLRVAGSVDAVYDLMDSARRRAPKWETTSLTGKPYRPALDSLGR
jgi:hypothetical protein